MLGFYDYTVILTYMSLASSIIGMFCAFSGHLHLAITCLALSGLFDTFDGKVARTKKNRTEEEKHFGIQIDSLCDVICFGVLPVIICYFTGLQDVSSMGILILYCLAGLIRLAYFNVIEERRQKETSEKRKYYQGLPITSISVILPLVYVGSFLYEQSFLIVLRLVMLLTAVLFIGNFRFRKPNNKELAILIGVVAVAVVYILLFFRWRHIQWSWRDVFHLFRRARGGS